jgi:hypothetical protein
VYYSVRYVSKYISQAQEYYNADKDSAAKEALLNAEALLREADEDWAADKVHYYTRFM